MNTIHPWVAVDVVNTKTLIGIKLMQEFKTRAVEKIFSLLKSKRLDLSDEKNLQLKLYKLFVEEFNADNIKREFVLDAQNRLDFMFMGQIGIEVKIKGNRRQIYEQCVRYCGFDQVKVLIVITNRAMIFPSSINCKDCYVLKLGAAWL